MHVAHPVPATWRGGTTIGVAARLRLRERVVNAYRQLSDGEGILEALRALGARALNRITKARSLTQSASAFERLGEDLIALRCAGVPPHQLRRAAAELESIIDDMDPAPTTPSLVLVAVQVAQQAEAVENAAESQLLCRGDRELTAGDLERLIEAKEAEIAADRQVITEASKLRSQLRAARVGIRALPGGAR